MHLSKPLLAVCAACAAAGAAALCAALKKAQRISSPAAHRYRKFRGMGARFLRAAGKEEA